MSNIISIHSYRGGTGKSNISANVSSLLASQGMRVGVVDTDIQSPGIHAIFGLEESQMQHSLNDYLWGNCEIAEAAHDVTANVNPDMDGKIFMIPSSLKPGEIAKILREGYDVGLLDAGFQDLISELDLDYLVIDTHPGLNEETLLSIAISDKVILILRPDTQDYMGTSVTVEVARKLDVAELLMVVNKIPTAFDLGDVQKQVEDTYKAEVAAMLPHSDELMMLGSAGVFVFQFPDNPVTEALEQLVERLQE